MSKTTEAKTTELFYEPGNGSRYHLLYTVMGKRRVLTWLWKAGSGGGCIVYNEDAYVSPHYLMEKMGFKYRGGGTWADMEILKDWIVDRQEVEGGGE